MGIAVQAQLCITSQAHETSSPITLSEVDLFFEGGLRNVKIFHRSQKEADGATVNQRLSFFRITLDVASTTNESSPSPLLTPNVLSSAADLTFPPGVTKVFDLNILPRDAGEVLASRALLSVHEEMFDLDVNVQLREHAASGDWWTMSENGLKRQKLALEHPCSAQILPKPPKLQISLPNMRKAYYTDESIEIEVLVTNGEDDVADVRLFVELSHGERAPTLHWSSDQSQDDSDGHIDPSSASKLEDVPLGELPPSAAKTKSIKLQALPQMLECVLEVRAEYFLLSDPDTPVSKSIRGDINFIGPFEANYDFLPSIHPAPWPNFFQSEDLVDDDGTPQGLVQRWTLLTKIASFGIEPLVVKATTLEILGSKYGAVCSLMHPDGNDSGPVTIHPNELISRSFNMEVRKSSLEDHRSSIITFQLSITWYREVESDGSNATTTSLLVPSLAVPFGEPRVLASSQPSPATPSVINLIYMIENPSMHMLTFSLTMEASEEFAFSGPKAMTVHLVPLSRRAILYNLLPIKQGVWIRPSLKVLDVGFGKVLRIAAAEGCRADKKGITVWAEAE